MKHEKQDIYYSSFDSFVFRAPLLPISLLQVVYEKGIYEAIKANQEIFDQALYLASPNIFRKYKRRLKGRLKEDDLEFDLVLLKYIIRMTTRCTPFGLFAGIGTGSFQEQNQIILSDLNLHSTHTKFSQDFVYHFYETLKFHPVFLKSSSYHYNNTLYQKHKKIRYTEYEDYKGYRKYTLSEVENNKMLADIFDLCEQGNSGNEIISYLTREGVSKKEACAYLRILVENKVLISNMEPCTVADDMLEDFFNNSVNKNWDIPEIQFLKSLNEKLNEFDNTSIGLPVKEYIRISESVKNNSTFEYSDKVLHVDLVLSTKYASLENQVISNIYSALDILNRLRSSNNQRFLEQFRQKFYRRYENEEIPLIEALDSESGIPIEDKDRTDNNPLIDDIRISSEREQIYIKLTPQLQVLTESYNRYLADSRGTSIREMTLDNEMIKTLPANWDDLPPTFYVFSEIIKQNGKPLIHLKGASGVSATNILARFHQTSPAIKNLLSEIADKEKQLHKDAVVAEIVHLPETRTGNVLLRPDMYDYHIPIVATSQKCAQYQLPVTDLMISVPNGQRFLLRSKKLNKLVVPRLSSAQNFTKNSIPAYRFLCYLQMQGMMN